MSQQPPWPQQQSPYTQQPQWQQVPPQPGQFQPQLPPQYRPPQSSKKPWHKKWGVMIGLLCSILIVVLALGYGVTTLLDDGKASTPAATAVPSGQSTVAGPTATLALTPTHEAKAKATPTAKVIPTRAAASTPAPSLRPMTIQVTITNAGFSPANITIAAGSTVIWTNSGGISHTVTDSGKFDSGNLPPGATYSHTFTTPGTYHYVCIYHPYMVGTITVE